MIDSTKCRPAFRWELLFVLLTFGVIGCSRQESPQSSKPNEPQGQRLTADVVNSARQQGQQIVGETFQLLSTNLANAIRQGGVSNALPFCSAAALPLTRSLAEQQGVTVRRFSHRPRNPQGKADAFELQILQIFEQAILSSRSPEPIITNLVPGKVTFLAPIVLSQPLCLQCHGKPGSDIAPGHLALIDRLYPQDQARGFSLGELRGGWRVEFPFERLSQPAR